VRRKDLLIIVTALVVITFLAVFGIYYIVNDGEIFTKVKEEIVEIAKKEKHSNGWSTSIVDKIVHDVPIPVGFTYIEGDNQTGIIVKDNETNEKYMWIPAEGTIEAIDFEVSLEGIVGENRENILEYNGFYAAIESIEEGFEKENYANIEIDEKTKLDNYSKTSIIETNTLTVEELASIIAYSEKIGKSIILNNYKTVTVLGGTASKKESNKSKIEEKFWSTDIIGDIVEGAPIPKGFEYVEGTEKTGVKIKNRDNLYFIWIPVKNMDKVKETFKANAVAAGLDPDDEYGEIQTYEKYKDEAGDEYNALVESIKKYGGFYISEAELGYDKNGNSINIYREMDVNKESGYHHVTNGDYYRNVKKENRQEGLNSKEGEPGYFKLTYKSAKEKCEELYKDSVTVSSHLTYGLEYDAVVNYLIENGLEDEKAFNDSTEIGKDSNSDKNTVWKDKFLLNGIYGLAGNLAEITQEKDGDKIIVRGGNWNVGGRIQQLASKVPMTEKEIAEDEETIGFRACLYIKTKYDNEKTQKLKEEINKRIDKIRKHIDEISIHKKGTKNSYFNNKSNKSTKKYENKSLENIVVWAKTQMEKETSSVAFGKIEKFAKEQVDIIKDNIESILAYQPYKEIADIEISKTDEIADIWVKLNLKSNETVKISEICLKIKEKAVEEIQGLVWQENEEGKIVVKNNNGKETSYASTRIKAEENIKRIYSAGLFAGGRGTEREPYLIENKEQLENLAKIVNLGDNCKGKYYKIEKDIDLENKKWIPIGKIVELKEENQEPKKYFEFSGNLDGGEHKIKNIHIEEKCGAALIGYLGGGEIKNIIIESGTITANELYAGGIVSYARNGTITNCKNKGTIKSNEDYVGGIVGRVDGNTIVEKCKNKGSVEGVYFAGGIAGYIRENATIKDGVNSGKVKVLENFVGGIVGLIEENAKVEGCINEKEGKVVAQMQRAGGIVGNLNGNGGLKNCVNNGAVQASDVAGGIVGGIVANGNINNCDNNGQVTANSSVGGIAGWLRESILDIKLPNCENMNGQDLPLVGNKPDIK